MDPTGEIIISRNVIFNEESFPFKDKISHGEESPSSSGSQSFSPTQSIISIVPSKHKPMPTPTESIPSYQTNNNDNISNPTDITSIIPIPVTKTRCPTFPHLSTILMECKLDQNPVFLNPKSSQQPKNLQLFKKLFKLKIGRLP